jgi:hypothetical protein
MAMAMTRDRPPRTHSCSFGSRLRKANAVVALALFPCGACGNGADGIGACRQIEYARCNRAPSCGISLEPPYHTSGNDVEACIQFYDVACLHGLSVAQPSGALVNACVAAIQSPASPCSVVQTPTNAPECGWLGPAATTTLDAAIVDGAEADTDAGGADAEDDATMD